MAEELVTIEVDGVTLQAPKGEMLIRVTDQAGIDVPRFCYHDKLSVAANCRMCLVEVEKARKPMPACATPIMDGMKVFTRSPAAISAQSGAMEFLLINHPLDCPICDQGGECELQDLAMGYGAPYSRFVEGKRSIEDKDVGPLIRTNMTRCIYCTRCIRFGDEIAGLRELGATGRGEFTEVGTYIAHSIVSEVSANVIDLCPVGALLHKPSLNAGRSWEMSAHKLVAPHDAVGSNVFMHILRGRVIRVVPRENEAVNEIWLSDRDRFSYEGLQAPDRLERPMIRRDGEWIETDWETALEAAAEALRGVVDAHGADALGLLASPTSTLEELYLFQRLGRRLGCANIDHRLREWDFSDQEAMPAYPGLGREVASLERIEAAFLVGSFIRHEAPLLGLRLRKAALRGGSISLLNPVAYPMNFPVAEQLAVRPDAMVDELIKVVAALDPADIPDALPEAMQTALNDAQPQEAHRRIAQSLKEASDASVILGHLAASHPRAAVLRAWAMVLARATGARPGVLGDAGNSTGAWLAGVVPHREAGGEPCGHAGMHVRDMLEQPRHGYLLMNVEPSLDLWDGALAERALAQADAVVMLTPFASEAMKAVASVLLPMAAFGETAGTFVNAEGRWQTCRGAARPAGEARPGWKVLRVLGNLLDLDGFDYLGPDEVLAEARSAIGEPAVDFDRLGSAPLECASTGRTADGIVRIGEIPIYAVDMLVRRARPLQETPLARVAEARMNPVLCERLGLAEGDRIEASADGGRAELPLRLDESVPDGAIWLAAGIEQTAALGPRFGPVNVKKA